MAPQRPIAERALEVDFEALSHESRWTALNIAMRLSYGFTVEELKGSSASHRTGSASR
jgi:hypothetical protein